MKKIIILSILVVFLIGLYFSQIYASSVGGYGFGANKITEVIEDVTCEPAGVTIVTNSTKGPNRFFVPDNAIQTTSHKLDINQAILGKYSGTTHVICFQCISESALDEDGEKTYRKEIIINEKGEKEEVKIENFNQFCSVLRDEELPTVTIYGNSKQ